MKPVRAITTIWAIYAWPGGRWLLTGWAAAPGAEAEHGPLQWASSLEAARAMLPPGLERRDPHPEDVEDAAALVETWR